MHSVSPTYVYVILSIKKNRSNTVRIPLLRRSGAVGGGGGPLGGQCRRLGGTVLFGQLVASLTLVRRRRRFDVSWVPRPVTLPIGDCMSGISLASRCHRGRCDCGEGRLVKCLTCFQSFYGWR